MKKLTLNLKLSFSFGLQLVFISVLAVIGFVALSEVTSNYKRILDDNVPKERLLSEFRMTQKDIVVLVRSSSGADVTEAVVTEQLKALDDANARFEKSAAKFEQFPLEKAEKEAWDEIKDKWKPLIDISRKIVTSATSEDAAVRSAREKWLKTDFDLARKNVRTPVEKLKDFQAEDSEKWAKAAEQGVAHAKWEMTIAVAAGILFGLMSALYMIIHLHRLFTRITSNLSKGADHVATAASEISTSSGELSSSVAEQAAAIQETSSAIEEISSMISKTSDNANRSRQISEESQSTVADGQDLMQQMVKAIQEIDQSNAKINAEIDNSNREIKEIVKVIAEIGAKTQVINDIVFQTKLLSFNASVEAARAGEHGKGFAVVAEEVGNLAQMSGNAAKEISGMLDGGIAKVEGIVTNSTSRVEILVKTGKDKVLFGMDLAQRCDKAFKVIVSKTEEVRNLVAEISTATQEQSTGVNEVSKAIAQLNEATQQNNTVSETSASFAQQLTHEAGLLSSVVSELVEVVTGSRDGQAKQVQEQTASNHQGADQTDHYRSAA